MDTKITFIHAADLHLDSPFKGLTHAPETIFSQIRKSTFQAFDHLVSLAINNDVDFIVLVGDLFDNDKQSLKAQVHLRNGFESLHNHNINVYLSYGNHDYIKGNIHPIQYPENVFIFDDESISSFVYEKNGKQLVRIYGFSYENQAVFGDKSKEFNRIDDHIPFHIAMLHGTLYGNEEHDPYAPFRLGVLREKAFDYWALGHIHKRNILNTSPPIVYPGNSQGRHRHEHGQKGCYLVSLTREHANLSFVPLQSILFSDLTINLTHCKTIHDAESLIYEAIEQKECAQLIYIKFKSDSYNIYEWEESQLFDELIEIINESLLNSTPWIFIYRYSLQQNHLKHLKLNDYFIDEYIKYVDNLDIRTIMQQLISHRVAKRYVKQFTQAEQLEIQKQAKQLIITRLFQGSE